MSALLRRALKSKVRDGQSSRLQKIIGLATVAVENHKICAAPPSRISYESS